MIVVPFCAFPESIALVSASRLFNDLARNINTGHGFALAGVLLLILGHEKSSSYLAQLTSLSYSSFTMPSKKVDSLGFEQRNEPLLPISDIL
jgi:hypothetical protein